MDHLERELAGIASRLELMERETSDRKRLGPPIILENSRSRDIPFLALKQEVDTLKALVTQMAKVQRMQQDAIEELSIMGYRDNAEEV